MKFLRVNDEDYYVDVESLEELNEDLVKDFGIKYVFTLYLKGTKRFEPEFISQLVLRSPKNIMEMTTNQEIKMYLKEHYSEHLI